MSRRRMRGMIAVPQAMAPSEMSSLVASWEGAGLELDDGNNSDVTSWPADGTGPTLAAGASVMKGYTGEWGPQNRGHLALNGIGQYLTTEESGIGDLMAGSDVGPFSIALAAAHASPSTRHAIGWSAKTGGSSSAVVSIRTSSSEGAIELYFRAEDGTESAVVFPGAIPSGDNRELIALISYGGAGTDLRLDIWTPQNGWTTRTEESYTPGGSGFADLEAFNIGAQYLGSATPDDGQGRVQEVHLFNAALDAAQMIGLQLHFAARHEDQAEHLFEKSARIRVIASDTETHASSPDGTNLMFPCIVAQQHVGATKDWAIFFGAHSGTAIGLAECDDLFDPEDYVVDSDGAGVTLAAAETAFTLSGNDHISSPHVWWDPVAEVYRMTFHYGNTPHNSGSAYASSPSGPWTMDFGDICDRDGTGTYLRPFKYGSTWYAFGNNATLFKSTHADGRNGYERITGWGTIRADLLTGALSPRHMAVIQRGDTLVIFYSVGGDYPEHIRYADLDLSVTPDSDWIATARGSLLLPYSDDDGYQLAWAADDAGEAVNPIHQVRDPAIVEDGANVYLMYAQQGEQAIAIVDITEWIDETYPVS